MTADRPDQVKVEKPGEQSHLSAAHLSPADMQIKPGAAARAEMPAAFKGKSDLTIVDDQIARSIADARAKMTPEQLARAEYEANQPRHWIDASTKTSAIARDGGKTMPPPGDDAVAQAMAFARSRMTPEQISRVEHEAAGPMRHIQAAAKLDEARHDARKSEVTAKPGDTYWGVAHDVVADRKGSRPSNHEVHGMVKQMAAFNGKTTEQANHLKVGETIKIPPLELKHK